MIKNDLKILIQKKENLIKRLIQKKEPEFIRIFAQIIDQYFKGVFEKSTLLNQINNSNNSVAIVALGGYGRQEQCVHSDVDILILFKDKISIKTDKLIKELIYPLWNARIETGYSVRTINECLSMAWNSFGILTTLLDARFICGNHNIYFILIEKFKKELLKKYLEKSLDNLIEYGKKRHLNFGDSTYLLEPNLKLGHGGLRDYHTLLWYMRIVSNIKIQTRKDIEHYGFLSHKEFKTMEDALNFIWDIRNRLHYITDRKCDQIHFEYQTQVAELFKFKQKNGNSGVERFLGVLHSKMDYLKQINHTLIEEIQIRRKIKKSSNFPRPTKVSGIEIRNRRLDFSSIELVPQHPDLLLKIFVESGRLKIPLSIDALRIVSEFKYIINAQFRKKKSNVKEFKKILSLSLWEFNVLNVMHSTGLLKKLIPEFSLITNKIQYTHYHLFPVDKHSIRCVQIINSFKKQCFNSNIYNEIKNKKLLLLTALIHDIGKGDPAYEHSQKGAKIARLILKRFGYKPLEIQEVVFLIKNHLFLIKIATRRDIQNEETAVFCANKIETLQHLKKLYILTVADSLATGPKAWNKWTESLLRDLFLKTMNIIKHGEFATKKAHKIIQQKKDKLLSLKKHEWDEKDLKKEIELMSPRYFFYVPLKDIIKHISLFKNLGEKDFLWEIKKDRNSEIRTVSICARDKPGFYSKLAGVFSLNHLDIIGSTAYLLNDDTVLDIFKVKPPKDRIFENEKWEKTERDLQKAIYDDNFLNKLKIPKKFTPSSGQIPVGNSIKFDNKTSSFFTIIEVVTYDFQGLLFTITNILYKKGIDVRIAMVATKIDQIIDVFYVKTVEGAKIDDPEKIKDIKNEIFKKLPKIAGHVKD